MLSARLGPSVIDESLIILVDGNRTAEFYLYDSIPTDVGMGMAAAETTQKYSN